MTKRQITPHKGGRTEQLHVRIKPDVKRRLEQYAKAQDITVSDLIENFADNLSIQDKKNDNLDTSH